MIKYVKENKIAKDLSKKWNIREGEIRKHITKMARYITEISINEIVKVPKNFSEKQKNLLKKKIPVYWGGPVNKNKVFILHTNEYSDKSTIKIRDLSISSDYETYNKNGKIYY